jgi:hypothetical protein
MIASASVAFPSVRRNATNAIVGTSRPASSRIKPLRDYGVGLITDRPRQTVVGAPARWREYPGGSCVRSPVR